MALEKKSGWRSWVSILSGVVSLFAIIIIVTHIGEVEDILAVFKRTNPYWLFTALLLQAGTYICIAWIWKVFRKDVWGRLAARPIAVRVAPALSPVIPRSVI